MLKILNRTTLSRITFQLEQNGEDSFCIQVIPEEKIRAVQYYDEGLNIPISHPKIKDVYEMYKLLMDILACGDKTPKKVLRCIQLFSKWNKKSNYIYCINRCSRLWGRPLPELLSNLAICPLYVVNGFYHLYANKDSFGYYIYLEDRRCIWNRTGIFIADNYSTMERVFFALVTLLKDGGEHPQAYNYLKQYTNVDEILSKFNFYTTEECGDGNPYIKIYYSDYRHDSDSIRIYHPELFPEPIIFGFGGPGPFRHPSFQRFYNTMNNFISDDFNYEMEAQECYDILKDYTGFPLIRNHLDELFEKRKEMCECGRVYGKVQTYEEDLIYNDKDKQTTQTNSSTTSFFS